MQHIHLPHNLIVDGTVKSKIGFKKLRAVPLNACFDEFINMALVYLPEMATYDNPKLCHCCLFLIHMNHKILGQKSQTYETDCFVCKHMTHMFEGSRHMIPNIWPICLKGIDMTCFQDQKIPNIWKWGFHMFANIIYHTHAKMFLRQN